MIRTKIIATVGPASESPDLVGRLIDAGVDVFRLNFSHGTLGQHAQAFAAIRAVAGERGAMVGVMADLCGAKIRVDQVEGDAFSISPGDHIDIVAERVIGTPRRIATNRPQLVEEVGVGHRVLIDDGSVRLRVEEVVSDRLRCICEVGGRIGTRKGINLPDSDLQMSALTDKDRDDLAWIVGSGMDYVALSFVRTAADVAELRALLPEADTAPQIVAKIETPRAIDHLDEIIEAADVVLVARGDLGIEVELTRVPILQKEITSKCQAAGKPVIVATQMLQSMVEHPTATRAEVSDVANAVLDGADSVMLSAETSIGAYPVEAVRMMDRIAEETEAFLTASGAQARMEAASALRWITTAVAHGASLLARELDARLVVAWTEVGNTARLLSKCRLSQPVVGLSSHEHVCRRMSLYYGVLPACMPRHKEVLGMLREVDELLLERELALPGDRIVVVAGARLEEPGATNALLLHRVGSTEQGLPQFT